MALAYSGETGPARTARVGGLLYMVLGIITLLVNLPVIAHMARQGDFPVVFGIPLLGTSYVERLGMDFLVRAALGFELVCALEALAGYWIWQGKKRGGLLALALFPLAVGFWVLFQLPYFFVGGPLKLALVVLGWRSLRR